jgi:tetratricopeptide (TPR) repeat protein
MRVLLLALVVLATSAVEADSSEPVPPKARKLAERGRELHERGDYTRAIAAFKEAYVLAPSPGLLFNLAQAYRLQGNCDDAAAMYRRYLAASAPSSDERALAEAHLATVVRCVQRRNLNLPPDDAMGHIPVPAPPAPDPLFVDAAAAPAPEGGRLLRDAGIGTTLSGAVALTAAAYFGLRAYGAAADVERLYAEGASWRVIEPIHERGERAETAARWLGIGGGIGAAAGVTLYVLGRRAEHAPPLTVAPAKDGARVGLSWTF